MSRAELFLGLESVLSSESDSVSVQLRVLVHDFGHGLAASSVGIGGDFVVRPRRKLPVPGLESFLSSEFAKPRSVSAGCWQFLAVSFSVTAGLRALAPDFRRCLAVFCSVSGGGLLEALRDLDPDFWRDFAVSCSVSGGGLMGGLMAGLRGPAPGFPASVVGLLSGVFLGRSGRWSAVSRAELFLGLESVLSIGLESVLSIGLESVLSIGLAGGLAAFSAGGRPEAARRANMCSSS